MNGQDIVFEQEFMKDWSDKQKAEFAFQILATLPPHEVIQVVERISPYLHRDILSQLPYEIAVHALSFLDVHSLLQATQVSRGWHTLCEEQALWKNRFELEGWYYNKREISRYLMDEEESQPFSTIPIRRSQEVNHPWKILYNLKSKASPSSSAHEAIKKLKITQPEDESSRYINWKELYKNRYRIEQRWLTGRCNISTFPPPTCPVTDLHKEGIYCLQFDRHKLITGSRDRTVKVWDLTRGVCQRTLSGLHTRSVLCLQYDDRVLVTGSSDASLVVTDLETGEVQHRLVGHQDSVLNLRLIHQDRVISCSKDRTLRLWNRNEGRCLRIFEGHRAPVNAVQWHQNRVVSGSGDRTIRIWDLETGDCLKTLAAHTRGVACVEFDGTRIVSGSSDQTIKVWDAHTGECIYTLVGHMELVRTIQLDSSTNRIMSGCYDGQLKVWNLKEGRLLRDLGQAVDGRILNLKFSSTKLACCSNTVSIAIYDFADGIDTKFLV